MWSNRPLAAVWSMMTPIYHLNQFRKYDRNPKSLEVIEVIQAGKGELEYNKIGKKDICSFCNEVKFITAEDINQVNPQNSRYYCAGCYEDRRRLERGTL